MEVQSAPIETKIQPARLVLNDPLLRLHLHDRSTDADLWLDPEADKRVQLVVRRVRNGDLMSGMQAQVERQISQYIMHMGLYDLKTSLVYHFNNDLSTLGQAHTARLVRTSLAQFVGGFASGDRTSMRGKFFYVHTGLSAEQEEAALKRCEELLGKGGLLQSDHGQLMHYDPMHWNCQHLAFYLLYGHKQYKGQASRAASAAANHFIQQARSSKVHPALAGLLNDPAVLKTLSDVLGQSRPNAST